MDIVDRRACNVHIIGGKLARFTGLVCLTEINILCIRSCIHMRQAGWVCRDEVNELEYSHAGLQKYNLSFFAIIKLWSFSPRK